MSQMPRVPVRHRARHCRGGALATVMLAVLILGAVAVVALVSTCVYLARNVRVAESTERGETSVETPFGSIHVRENAAFDPKHMGIPIYPGAARRRVGHNLGSLHLDFGDRHKDLSVVMAEYRTYDSLDKVTEFYHHELPHWMLSQKRHGGMQLELTEGGYRKMIAIYEDGGETRVALASMGEPASN